MSTNIYIYGCSCGIKANQVAKVKKFYPNAKVYNTKYSLDKRSEQIGYLNDSGIGTNQYHPIVVEDGDVTLLSQWNPL